MSNSTPQSPLDSYGQYLSQNGVELDPNLLSSISAALRDPDWEDPQSAIDLNNFAVLALIEAEQAEDLSIRQLNLEMAIEALKVGVELGDYPLCVAHLALVKAMLGESTAASEIALANFLDTLQPAYQSNSSLPIGLVYLPPTTDKQEIQQLLEAENGWTQTLLLFALALCQGEMIFYSPLGLRFLQLGARFLPNSARINLQLGLSSLMNGKWEGLLYLQEANKLAPHNAKIIQALYLTYKGLKQEAISQFWQQKARNLALETSDSPNWSWAQLPLDSPFTYVPFEGLSLAVESNLRSIVTTVLLGQGDWFEPEMEFWRSQLKPGMTVIDVGANVGVYTFSAAQQVGSTGKVLAVEPFSTCLSCLQETCHLNQLSWVTICRGAASDSPGTAHLALHSANELNEVIVADSPLLASGNVEEIACFTLDSLIEQENLSQVDWLKIDAEGHELQVLKGSEQILARFSPKILYENIAGSKGSNLPVAEFLQAQGYQLFRYQPFLQQLIPIDYHLNDLQGQLNVIAFPTNPISH